ncbi:hypothetical protein [Noviherbaspirillum pedocola]|uniref:Uncharacterized protein n=1 Tax=Noviherbaspirillum pedocola TaxID=2801341 RepID=A0A934SYM1_9BURK|nr:hypothetical protein [Noviherbaspirillum pedocola]MBK4735317.1 hypothetical protein [Noviherbaspirillum pedocola]
MSSLVIRNIAPDAALDRRAMAAIRGGTAGSPSIAINIPINVAQTNNMEQHVAVLNHSIIGPGVDLGGLQVRPTQIGFNALALPPRFL